MQRNQIRLRLKNSPLVMVLAQVRISPILKMGEYVPALQEQLRHEGYPRFRAEQVQEVDFGPQPRFTQRERWLFADKDNREAVVLAQDFVALETNRYDCFEDFSARLAKVLRIVGTAVGASLSERLGLRYVDLILPAAGETLDEYLQSKLHGLRAGELAIEKVLNRFEARGVTGVGQLVVRLHQNESGAFLPPDLMPAELTPSRVVEKGQIITLLDIDHFSEQSKDYDPPALVEAMWQLHEYTEKAFMSSVTPLALERWGKE